MRRLTELYQLVTEGIFEVPKHVYQAIIDDLIRTNRDYQRQKSYGPLNQPTNFPAVFYDLDLRGTSHEYLQYLEPQVKVRYTTDDSIAKDANYCDFDWKLKKYAMPDHGVISLNLNKPVESHFKTSIEHEVLHYIQDLIKLHQEIKKTGKEKKDIVWPDVESIEGGQVKRKIVPTVKGDKLGRKRHHQKYYEFMTNLNTFIRSMVDSYNKWLKRLDRQDTSIQRKKYFKMVVSGSMTFPYSHILKRVKKSTSPGLYNEYLKKTYDYFVGKKIDEETENKEEN